MDVWVLNTQNVILHQRIKMMELSHPQLSIEEYGFKPDCSWADIHLMLQRQNIDNQIRMIAEGVGGRLARCEEWILNRSGRNDKALRCGKKAIELLNTPEMIRIVSPGKHYSVKSQSESGYYDVKLDKNNRWECDCYASKRHMLWCKHSLAVAADAADRAACQSLGVREPGHDSYQCHDNRSVDVTSEQQYSMADLLKKLQYQRAVEAVMPPNFLIRRWPLPYLQPCSHTFQWNLAPTHPPPSQQPLQDAMLPLYVPTCLPSTYDHMIDSEGFFHVLELGKDSGSCPPCKRCGRVTDVIKKGFAKAIKSIHRDDYGIKPQKYKCKACNIFFVFRAGQNHMRLEIQIVADMCDEFIKGYSYADIVDTLARHGIKIHPTTAGRIIKKYISMMGAFVSYLPLKLGCDWAADERYIKIEKKEHYLFGVIDTKTRFLISWDISDTKDGYAASKLFNQSQMRASVGRPWLHPYMMPVSITTDKLDSYQVAFKEVFAPHHALDEQCVHLKDAAINNVHANNNCYERQNGTQKDYTDRRRCTWKKTSPIFEGFMIWYNFVRKHSSLDHTPAEDAGIKIHGCDRWKTLIENACMAAWWSVT